MGVLMVNLDAFKLRDIQVFIHVLNQCEIEGYSDIVVLRQRLYEHLARSTEVLGKVGRKIPGKIPGKIQYTVCPSCGAKSIVRQQVEEHLVINICKKPCGYSEVVK